MSRLVSPDERIAARDVLLNIGAWEVAADFEPYLQFASGKEANNKFNMEQVIADEQPSEVQDAWLVPMARIATAYRPDALWGVPSGGQEFAKKLGERLGLPVLIIKKYDNKPGFKTYEEDPDHLFANGEILDQANRLVAVEDAGTEFTSLHGALHSSIKLAWLARLTVGATVGWFRGLPEEARDLRVPFSAVVKERVPNIITPNHPFFKRYGHLAVRRLAEERA